jgi:hypothetical protein
MTHLELDAALLTAEAAVGFDQLFCRMACFGLPSARGRVV